METGDGSGSTSSFKCLLPHPGFPSWKYLGEEFHNVFTTEQRGRKEASNGLEG